MADEGVDFDRNWTMQSEALKAELMDTVSAVSVLLLTLQIQTEYPSLMSGESKVPVITFACQTDINNRRLSLKNAAVGKENKNDTADSPPPKRAQAFDAHSSGNKKPRRHPPKKSSKVRKMKGSRLSTPGLV
jgi:hypothetical protein